MARIRQRGQGEFYRKRKRAAPADQRAERCCKGGESCEEMSLRMGQRRTSTRWLPQERDDQNESQAKRQAWRIEHPGTKTERELPAKREGPDFARMERGSFAGFLQGPQRVRETNRQGTTPPLEN